MAINVNKKNHIKIAPNNGTISTDCGKLNNLIKRASIFTLIARLVLVQRRRNIINLAGATGRNCRQGSCNKIHGTCYRNGIRQGDRDRYGTGPCIQRTIIQGA